MPVLVNGLWTSGAGDTTSGTVSSITAGTGITLTPNPIVSTGTMALANTAVTPGAYTLRLSPTPYLTVERGDVCLEPGAGGTTRLVAARAGPFELGVPGPSELLRIAFGARPGRC